MEDYTVGGLPPLADDLLLSDPPIYYADSEQSQSDTDHHGGSQLDKSFKIHYHSMLDGMPLFFIHNTIDIIEFRKAMQQRWEFFD
jgi:hypothetical protein